MHRLTCGLSRLFVAAKHEAAALAADEPQAPLARLEVLRGVDGRKGFLRAKAIVEEEQLRIVRLWVDGHFELVHVPHRLLHFFQRQMGRENGIMIVRLHLSRPDCKRDFGQGTGAR